MWHTRIIQVFYVLSKKVGSFCFCSYTSAAAATKRGIFWARTPLFPSSLLLFNNRKRLMLQLDLFSTLLASLSLSPSLLLIYVLMILLSAIGCQWERNYNVWSFCSSFVLPLSIHSLDDAGMTDYKQDWKCWCVYYFISCSLWPEMAHQNQRKNRFWVQSSLSIFPSKLSS